MPPPPVLSPRASAPVCGRDTPLPRPSARGPSPLPPLPQDNGAFHNQTKRKSLKGENYVSTTAQGVGRGEGGGGLGRSHRHRRNGPVCIYSRLTQHNLIFHRKDQIIFQLQLITHPKSTSKNGPRPPSPCSAAPRAPGFHAPLRGVGGTGAQPFPPTRALEAGPRGPRCLRGPQAPRWAPRTVLSPVDAWSPHQNSSPVGRVSLGLTLPRYHYHHSLPQQAGKVERCARRCPFVR